MGVSVCVHVCTCVCAHVPAWVCVRVHVGVSVCVCMCTCVCGHVPACVCLLELSFHGLFLFISPQFRGLPHTELLPIRHLPQLCACRQACQRTFYPVRCSTPPCGLQTSHSVLATLRVPGVRLRWEGGYSASDNACMRKWERWKHRKNEQRRGIATRLAVTARCPQPAGSCRPQVTKEARWCQSRP